MISADRMKSVRIALPTSASSFSGPCSLTSCLVARAGHVLPQLLGALEAEVDAADHQDRGQQPRQQLAEQSAAGRMNNNLLRSEPNAIRLIIGSSRSGRTLDVARGDRGVVDDHAGGLHARPPGAGGDVVDRRRGRPGEHGDVIQEGGESGAHAAFILVGTPGIVRPGRGPGIGRPSTEKSGHRLRVRSPSGRAACEVDGPDADARISRLPRVGRAPWGCQRRRDAVASRAVARTASANAPSASWNRSVGAAIVTAAWGPSPSRDDGGHRADAELGLLVVEGDAGIAHALQLGQELAPGRDRVRREAAEPRQGASASTVGTGELGEQRLAVGGRVRGELLPEDRGRAEPASRHDLVR